VTPGAAGATVIGEKFRWDVLVVVVLGSLVALGAVLYPWLGSWSLGIGTPPISFRVLDFGGWGYAYVLGTASLIGLPIMALVRLGARRRLLAWATVAAGVVVLASLLAASYEIHRYEIAARDQWGDQLWAAYQRTGFVDFNFNAGGLEWGFVATYLLGVAGLLAFSPRERPPKALAAVTAFALLLGLVLSGRVEWITDATVLEYRYDPILALGQPAHLLAAITVALSILLLLGGRAAASRRWVVPWLVTVVGLAVVAFNAATTVFDEVRALPAGTQAPEPHVDVEFTTVTGPFMSVLVLLPVVAVLIARGWHRSAKQRETSAPPEAVLPPSPRQDISLRRPLSWSRWRKAALAVSVAVIASVLSASLKEDEATKIAAMCTDVTNEVAQSLGEVANAVSAKPVNPDRVVAALRDLPADLRSAANKTDNQNIVRVLHAAATSLDQAATTKRLSPQIVEQLFSTLGDECGRPAAR